ncbi:MAG: glycosyltransferase family 2 protein [Anaerolineae bacterium]|nr:glycosyltransferase family 2 protein [Anaerolineae bacterium]
MVARYHLMDLSIVIVNWNVKNLLRHCLQSLDTACQSSPDLTTEIIVVDNASTDGSPQMAREEFPQIRLIASDDNLGYACGNNTGVTAAAGRYVFILNPDTVVQSDTLTRMVNYMDARPQVGASGPQLLWPDGSTQSSRRRFPTLGSLFWESTLLGQWFPQNRYAQRYHLADIPPDQTQTVDWLVGAALLIRREAWQQVGPIDQEFFMYFEETDWCRRAAEAGWEIHYLPEAKVTHYEGQSSQQVMAARTLRFQRSKLRYARKYFGRGWATTLYFFLWATFAIQWTEETLKWLIGHRRDLRRERMKAYGQILREL